MCDQPQDDIEWVHSYSEEWCDDCEGPCFFADWFGADMVDLVDEDGD